MIEELGTANALGIEAASFGRDAIFCVYTLAERRGFARTPKSKITRLQVNKTIRQLIIDSQSYAVSEPVEGKIRRFDKLSDQSAKSQKPKANSQKPKANSQKPKANSQ